MLSEMARKQDGNPLAALGTAFAMALVGPMVEAIVTPEALAMMMKGEKPSIEKSKPTAAPASPASEPDTEILRGRFVLVEAFSDPPAALGRYLTLGQTDGPPAPCHR